MQQIPFIDHFKSALHVSGDKLAHPQEHVLTVYTAFGTMHRYCCRPVARLSPVGSNICALYQNWFKKNNKRNLLHHVGCLHRYSNDSRSHKHQLNLQGLYFPRFVSRGMHEDNKRINHLNKSKNSVTLFSNVRRKRSAAYKYNRDLQFKFRYIER